MDPGKPFARPRIDQADLQAVVRLVVGVHDRHGPLPVTRSDLLERLCELLSAAEASMAICQRGAGIETRELRRHLALTAPPATLPLALADDPLLHQLLVQKHAVSPYAHTVLQRDLLRFDVAPSLRAARRATGWNEVMYSLLPLPDAQVGVLRLMQSRPHLPRWTLRQTVMMDLIHSELAELYLPPARSWRGGEMDLSPRESQTLQRLLKGMSEKQIALSMKLSVHTVHVYVKSIYRTFKVSSRGELLAKWVQAEH